MVSYRRDGGEIRECSRRDDWNWGGIWGNLEQWKFPERYEDDLSEDIYQWKI